MSHLKWFGNFHKIVLGITFLSVSEVSVSRVYGDKDGIITTCLATLGGWLGGYYWGKKNVPAPLPPSSRGGKQWVWVVIGGVGCFVIGASVGYYLGSNKKGTDAAEDTDDNLEEDALPVVMQEVEVQTDQGAEAVAQLEQRLIEFQRENDALQRENRQLNGMVGAFIGFGKKPTEFIDFGDMGDAGTWYRGIKAQLYILKDLDGFKMAIQDTVWKCRDCGNSESPISPRAAKQMSLSKLQREILTFITEIYTKSLETTNNLSRSVDRLTTENAVLLAAVQRLLRYLIQQMNGTGDIFGILFPQNQEGNPWKKGEMSLKKIITLVGKAQNHSNPNGNEDVSINRIVELLPENNSTLMPVQSFQTMGIEIKRLLKELKDKDLLACFSIQALYLQTGHLNTIFVAVFPSDYRNTGLYKAMEYLIQQYQEKLGLEIPCQVESGDAPLALTDEISANGGENDEQSGASSNKSQLVLPRGNTEDGDPFQKFLECPNNASLSSVLLAGKAATELITDEINKLQSAQEEAKGIIQKKTSALEQLQKEKAQLEKDHAKQAANFKKSQDELTAELNTSKNAVSQQQEQIQAQQIQDTEKQERINELQQQINRTKSELDAESKKAKELEAKATEAAQLQAQVVEIKRQIEVVHTTHVDRNQLINDLDGLIAKYRDPKAGNAAVRNGLITLLNSIKEKYKTKD